MPAERRFRVMGSDAHVIVVGGRDGLIDRAVERLDELEARWSRFLPDSEVSRMNEVAGDWTRVSADTYELVSRAVQGWQITGGAFDPTVLGDVLRSGYTANLPAVQAHEAPPAGSLLTTGCAGIELHLPTRLVRLPAGVGFDPGGIGKGLAADLLLDELISAGADGACVNLGGDLRVAGDAPQPGGWLVAVQHPHRDEPVATLRLDAGAVATSSTTRRTWLVDGLPRHHLVDPTTTGAAAAGAIAATAVAARGWQAEVLAKALVVRGAVAGGAVFRDRGATGCLVDIDGHVTTLAGFDDLTVEPALRAGTSRDRETAR